MATRRWFGELETWMRRAGWSKEAVARVSGHKAAHVLALFAEREPNTSLRLVIDLTKAAGARFAGVRDNTPRAVVAHLAAIARDIHITNSELARLTGVNRSQISTLFNDPDPNPMLALIDRIVVALDAEQDFRLVEAAPASAVPDDDADVDEADDVYKEDADEDDDVDEDDDEGDDDDDDDAANDDAANVDDEDDEDADADEDADDDEDDTDTDEDADEDEDEDEDAGDDDTDEDDSADAADVDDDDDADDDDADVDDADVDEDDDDTEGGEDTDPSVDETAQVLQAQNTALQRRVLNNEAEIRALKKQRRWGVVKAVASALLGAGVTAGVLKHRKDKE